MCYNGGMDTNTTLTHPDQDRMDVIRRRAQLLIDSQNSSAWSCQLDALTCMVKHEQEFPFPVERSQQLATSLPTTWLEAAERWVMRGAQHAFGFQLPEGW